MHLASLIPSEPVAEAGAGAVRKKLSQNGCRWNSVVRQSGSGTLPAETRRRPRRRDTGVQIVLARRPLHSAASALIAAQHHLRAVRWSTPSRRPIALHGSSSISAISKRAYRLPSVSLIRCR